MINDAVYSPYLQQFIHVCVPDVETLEEYAEAAVQVRDSVPDKCEAWHIWDAFSDVCFTALDNLRRRDKCSSKII